MNTYHIYEEFGGVGYFDGLPIEVTAENGQAAVEQHITSPAYDRGSYLVVAVEVGANPNLYNTEKLGYWRRP